MALSNQDQARIRDYLLGHLSSEEQQKIEERLMVEDELFEEFEISKDELIEEYRAGELNRNEILWFENHYLASHEGRQRHTLAVALKCLKPPTPQPKRLSWFEQLVSFFKQKPWAWATVTPVVLAAIAVSLIFPHIYGPKQTTLAITLESSAFNRAPSDPKYRRIQLTPDVGEVKIELMLPDSVTPGANYRVELDNRSAKTKPLNVSANSTRSVFVVIPAAELPQGLYALKLFAINSNGAEQRVGDYFFEIIN